MTALLDSSARGLFVVSVTPFLENGALDLPSVAPMVEFYLAQGATGITVLGVMGEAPKLTLAESVAFTREVIRCAAGRIPVVVGATAPGLAAMRELTEQTMAEGAAGVMVAAPASLRSDASILQYYQQVADTIGPVPFVLQDYPPLAGVTIPASVIRAIIDSVPTCVMLKHEDWPGLAKLSAVRAEPVSRRVSILSGINGLFLPEELRRGADGAMTGFSYPEMVTAMLAARAAGDDDRAGLIHDAYLPLLRYELQPGVGLAVRKYILAQRGAIACAAQRKPGTALSRDDIADIETLLARQDRRLSAIL